MRSIGAIFTFCFFASASFAGEYTNTFHLNVKSQGESLKMDPVESFNSAVEYATQSAIAQGEGVVKGASDSRDSVLGGSWIKKEAHLQVIDLEVTNYRFWVHTSPRYGKDLITDIEIEMTMEYLDVPRFVEDYNKTIQGAAFRSMAVPGWGQFYNRQYTTGMLFGISFWTFYGLFIQASASAGTDQTKIDNAFTNLQIPAMIFWSFNVSEAMTSRYLGRQGLKGLRQAYRLDDFKPQYELKTERGFKLDLILVQIPLY